MRFSADEIADATRNITSAGVVTETDQIVEEVINTLNPSVYKNGVVADIACGRGIIAEGIHDYKQSLGLSIKEASDTTFAATFRQILIAQLSHRTNLSHTYGYKQCRSLNSNGEFDIDLSVFEKECKSMIEDKLGEYPSAVIFNPPFSDHLKFTEKAFSIAERDVVVVQPANYLIEEASEFSDSPNTDFYGLREKLPIKSVKLFNGNGPFGISKYHPCAIVHIQRGYEGKIHITDYVNDCQYVTDEHHICKYGSDVEETVSAEAEVSKSSLPDHSNGKNHRFYDLKNKVTNYVFQNEGLIDQRHTKGDEAKPGEFVVSFARVRGNAVKNNNSLDSEVAKDDMYTFFGKADGRGRVDWTKKVIIDDRGRGPNNFHFKTRRKAENFVDYLKSDFARFCMSITKYGVDIQTKEMEIVPWLGFDESYEEKIEREFDLKDEEKQYIHKIIPEYHCA